MQGPSVCVTSWCMTRQTRFDQLHSWWMFQSMTELLVLNGLFLISGWHQNLDPLTDTSSGVKLPCRWYSIHIGRWSLQNLTFLILIIHKGARMYITLRQNFAGLCILSHNFSSPFIIPLHVSIIYAFWEAPMTLLPCPISLLWALLHKLSEIATISRAL